MQGPAFGRHTSQAEVVPDQEPGCLAFVPCRFDGASEQASPDRHGSGNGGASHRLRREARRYMPRVPVSPKGDNTLFVVFGTCHKLSLNTWSISLEGCGDPPGPDQVGGRRWGTDPADPLLNGYVDEWPHRNEHSIELQLPYAVSAWKDDAFEVLRSSPVPSTSMWRTDSRLDPGEAPALLES